MSTRGQEFRVGVVTLVIAGVAGLLATLGVGVSLPSLTGEGPYTIQIRTDRAPGVGPNTPVRKDGVVIGRVTRTEFLPTGGVLVTADIEPGAPIYRGDIARIRPSSLFGDAVINFAYADEPGPPEQLEPGATVQAVALPDPVEALTSLQVDVGPTLESIGRAADSVEQLTSRVNNALGDDFGGDRMNSLLDQVSRALNDFQQTMQVMNRTMTQIDSLASDPRLREAVDTVPQLLADAQGTVRKATDTLDRFGVVVGSAETNLRNLEGLTEPLGRRGPELSEKLISAVENLDRTLADASRFVTAVTDTRGSLNRLLSDPELYDNVATVIYNANVVLGEFHQRLNELRPVVHNARVFSDKIAREPGRIISGAIKPEPILK
ncbi:MlaD family protein [Botrimarina sp.]|uniref:MlaD family protein n=1 Tax=Botrimarina sp. TaxID=2795802 RepID=UPI0032EDD428